MEAVRQGKISQFAQSAMVSYVVTIVFVTAALSMVIKGTSHYKANKFWPFHFIHLSCNKITHKPLLLNEQRNLGLKYNCQYYCVTFS